MCCLAASAALLWRGTVAVYFFWRLPKKLNLEVFSPFAVFFVFEKKMQENFTCLFFPQKTSVSVFATRLSVDGKPEETGNEYKEH